MKVSLLSEVVGIIKRAFTSVQNFFCQGPWILQVCRFGTPYDLSRQAFRRNLMMEKIHRNSFKMGGYQNFKAGLIEQREMKRRQLIDKMRSLYALDQQLKFLKKYERIYGERG